MRRLTFAGAHRAAVLAFILLACGCSGPQVISNFVEPESRHLLPPDEMMSCLAIARSFRYAAARTARLQLDLASAAAGTFGTGHFATDAPVQVRQEEQRLDALADLERDHGCPVVAPKDAVAAERRRLLSPVSPSCIVRNGRCLGASPR